MTNAAAAATHERHREYHQQAHHGGRKSKKSKRASKKEKQQLNDLFLEDLDNSEEDNEFNKVPTTRKSQARRRGHKDYHQEMTTACGNAAGKRLNTDGQVPLDSYK